MAKWIFSCAANEQKCCQSSGAPNGSKAGNAAKRAHWPCDQTHQNIALDRWRHSQKRAQSTSDRPATLRTTTLTAEHKVHLRHCASRNAVTWCLRMTYLDALMT